MPDFSKLPLSANTPAAQLRPRSSASRTQIDFLIGFPPSSENEKKSLCHFGRDPGKTVNYRTVSVV